MTLERKGEDFLALQQYVGDKATLLERLGQMEEKRDKIKKAIFDKIRADYEGKLKKLVDEFRPIRIRIVQKLAEFEQEQAQIEKKLTFAQDKVIELRFRHQLGEYAEDEFRRMEDAHLVQVDQIQASWDELNADLEDYRSLIGDDKDFQRRFAYEEPAEVEPVEEIEERSEITEATVGAESTTDTDTAEDPEVYQPTGAGRGGRREAHVAARYDDAAYEDTEETEESTESTHDTSLMDDEELFGRYYKETDSDTVEMPAVEGYAAAGSDDSGTVEMPAGMGAGGFTTEDSSTGIWASEAMLGAGAAAVVTPPPPVAPPSKVAPTGKVPASFLGWQDSDEDKDSTMVWAGAQMKDVAAAAAAAPTPAPPPPPPPKALVVKDRKNKKDVTIPLVKPEISIGRSQDNDIVLTEGKISRRHAKVEQSDAGFMISDLNSSNGTFVNGKKITRPVLLHENDEILIGDSSMTYR